MQQWAEKHSEEPPEMCLLGNLRRRGLVRHCTKGLYFVTDSRVQESTEGNSVHVHTAEVHSVTSTHPVSHRSTQNPKEEAQLTQDITT